MSAPREGAEAPVGRAPIPEGSRLVLVFGGTFDPPHTAHVEMGARAREALGADLLLYVPAARSPHKDEAPGASAADRVEMLRLGLAGQGRCAVATIEIDRGALDPGPSYTVDTLRALRAEAPAGVRLRLLIGADQAAAFHRWREPREIIRLAEPAVMLRAPYGTAEALLGALSAHWAGAELEAWRGRVLALAPMEAEATDARDRIRRGESDSALGGLVPAPVLGHIRRRGLYTGGDLPSPSP